MTPTLVFIHGTGDCGWRRVQALVSSVAIDLPGRRDRPFDLSRAQPDVAAEIATRRRGAPDGPVVLVAHLGRHHRSTSRRCIGDKCDTWCSSPH